MALEAEMLTVSVVTALIAIAAAAIAGNQARSARRQAEQAEASAKAASTQAIAAERSAAISARAEGHMRYEGLQRLISALEGAQVEMRRHLGTVGDSDLLRERTESSRRLEEIGTAITHMPVHVDQQFNERREELGRAVGRHDQVMLLAFEDQRTNPQAVSTAYREADEAISAFVIACRRERDAIGPAR